MDKWRIFLFCYRICLTFFKVVPIHHQISDDNIPRFLTPWSIANFYILGRDIHSFRFFVFLSHSLHPWVQVKLGFWRRIRSIEIHIECGRILSWTVLLHLKLLWSVRFGVRVIVWNINPDGWLPEFRLGFLFLLNWSSAYPRLSDRYVDIWLFYFLRSSLRGLEFLAKKCHQV